MRIINSFIVIIVWSWSYSLSAFAQQTLTMQNSFLSLTVDTQTGAIISLHNQKTGIEYIVKSISGYYPFIVDAYSANKDFYVRDYQEKQSGGFSLALPESLNVKKGDLIHIRDSFLEKPVIEHKKMHYGSRLICSYHLADGIYLQYTIDMRDNSPLTEWKVRIENKPAVNPENDLRVYKLAFPVLDGLRVGNNSSDHFLARPYIQGELIPDPVNYQFCRPSRSVPTNVLTYLGTASMSWMDLYDKQGGLYFASYDPTLQQIDLEAYPDKTNDAITLDVRTLAFMEPGHSWESQTFIVGVHEGDWHWAADTYRAWAQSWMKPREAPQWLDDADGWFGTGRPNYRYGEDLSRMLDDARWLGLNYLQIWSEMLENVGDNFSRKAYYCFFLPDPDRGGEEGMIEGVRKVRESGGHIGFYSNVWTFDAELPRPLLQWKDKIPSNILIPDWWKEFRKYASVFPDGTIKAGDYLRKRTAEQYAGMCQSAEGWQDYLKYWVVDKYIKEYGIDVWYLDSMPVGMFGASRVCFSREHGKETPHGIGRGCIELIRKLKSGASSTGVTLALSSESINDALMQYETHALGIELVGSITHYPHPEIYTYTFPDHPIFSGTSNTWVGISQYYDDVPKPRHEDAMNRVFLLGYRFDAVGFPINRTDPYWLYMRNLINLRQQIKSYLYNSSFKDDRGIGTLPAKVEAKVFRHNSGKSLILTIVDRRQVKEGFELLLNMSRLEVEPFTKAIFYDFHDKKTVAINYLDENMLKLVIPTREYPEEPAAVVIE